MKWYNYTIPQIQLPDKQRSLFSRSIAVGLLAGCMALPVSGFAATIQGYKFNDINSDGVYSEEIDTTRPNEFIYIVDKDNERVFTPRTQSDGYYNISDLDPTHKFAIWVALPTDWKQTTPVPAIGNDGNSKIYHLDEFPEHEIIRIDFGVKEPQSTPEEPDDPCSSPTITSIQSGDWNEASTWEDVDGNQRTPKDSDIILISEGTEVIAPTGNSLTPSIKLKQEDVLCIAENAILRSASNADLFTQTIDSTSSSSELYINTVMQAVGKVYNYGRILGSNGMDGEGILPESACSWSNQTNCQHYKRATNGSNVKIFVDTLVNGLTGEIRSGDGGHDRTHEFMNGPPFGGSYNSPNPMPSYNYVSDGNNNNVSNGSGYWKGYWGIKTEGGKGGFINIQATATIDNQGLIKSGDGGDGDSLGPLGNSNQSDSVHGTTVGGDGGSIVVNDSSMLGNNDETPSINSGAIIGGCGGDADIASMFRQDSHVGNAPSWSDVFIDVNLASLKDGTVQGCIGEAISIGWDPTTMKVSSKTEIQGYDVVIYGRNDWTMDLRQLSEGAIKATKSITLAIGSGGIIDLRGVSGKVFHAGTKLTIFSDNLLLDDGIQIEDLTTATEVIVQGAKIMRRVKLLSNENFVGEPGESLPITVDIFNGSPEADNFKLEVTDEKGWISTALPSTKVIEALKQEQINFEVKLPESRGTSNTITLKAISQSDSSVIATEKLNISVSVGSDSDNDGVADAFDSFPNDITEWADSDLDGIGNNTDTDDDNDGMPDDWETQFGELSPVVNDAEEDADGDKVSNFAEFEADTDPIDPESKPDLPYVDLWIKDPRPDDGSEPGKASWIYISPDVWVRNQDDDVASYQNVKFGQDNYVYARVQNIGTLAAENTKVEIYRSGASMGQGWPRGWTLVGTGEISLLEPNASETVKVKWDKDTIPNPGHYCFYVRVDNEDDPMFIKEGWNMVQNTRNNNNVAWRNFNVVGFLNKVVDKFEVGVGNPTDGDTVVELVFDEAENLLQNDGVKAIVDLGVLFARWQDAGGEGENVQVLEGTEVQLLKTPAKFTGIPLKFEETLPITMRVDVTKPMPKAGESHTFHFSAREFIDSELVGGVDYAITTRALDTDSDGDGIKDVNDDDNDNDGIPDTWEIENGLNPLGPEDANEDADGDGATNKQEFEEGTLPNNANSKPLNYKASGHIRDEQGNPLAGVSILIDGRIAVTDENGYWEIAGLKEDKYEALASFDGFNFVPVDFVASHNTPEVTVEIPAPTSALDVTIEQIPTLVLEGEPTLTYAIEVKNNGHVTATGITLVNTLPAEVTAVEIETEAGTCNHDGNMTVNCDLLDLPVGQSWIVHIHSKPTASGNLINHVTVDSLEYPADDDTRKTYVRPHFSVSSWAKPYPVMVGGNIVYYLRIMNGQYSPAIAEDAEVKMFLSSGVRFVSADVKDDMGNCQGSSQIVTCNLNSIEADNYAMIEITAKALHSGNQQYTVQATATNFDPIKIVRSVNIVNPVIPGSIDLAFVVDITGSMQNDINAVVEALTQIITDIETNGQNAPMVGLITFKDDIVSITTTDDLRQIIRELQAIKPSGGNERFYCPEASVQAIAKALELLNVGGEMFVVTDAAPHPDTDIDDTKDASNAKQIAPKFYLSGDCTTFELTGVLIDEADDRAVRSRRTRSDAQCDTTGDDEMISAQQAYTCMANQTGGTVHDMTAIKSGDVDAVNAYVTAMMETLREVVAKVNPEPVVVTSGSGDDIPTTDVPGDGKGHDDGNEKDLEATGKGGVMLPPPAPNSFWIFVGSPNGHVVSQPAGIDCNKGEGQCFYYFKRGTKLKLIPQAPAGLYFDSWYGDVGCEDGEFTVTGVKGCSALFYGIRQ